MTLSPNPPLPIDPWCFIPGIGHILGEYLICTEYHMPTAEPQPGYIYETIKSQEIY
mgnify:CR=1 FL=1